MEKYFVALTKRLVKLKGTEIEYTHLGNITCPSLDDKRTPALFGVKQGAFIPIVGPTKAGKSIAGLAITLADYALLGETLYDPESHRKYVGPPANVHNLKKLISKSSGFLVIDSFSGVQPMESKRYAKEGLNLAVFELMQEIDVLCANTPMVIFGLYNPVRNRLLDDAMDEILARMRIVVQLTDGHQARIMDPITRNWTESIDNTQIYQRMIGAVVSKDKKVGNPYSVRSV